MNTTRKFYIIATILVAMIPFLNSCGENSKNEPTGAETADIDYFIDDMQELPKMLNITVEYTDKDGKTVSEVVESRTWAKLVKGVKIPFTAKIRIIYSKRSDFVADENKYTVANGPAINYKTSNGEERLLSTSVSKVLTKDGTEQYISKLTAAPTVLTVEIPAKRGK